MIFFQIAGFSLVLFPTPKVYSQRLLPPPLVSPGISAAHSAQTIGGSVEHSGTFLHGCAKIGGPNKWRFAFVFLFEANLRSSRVLFV